MLILKNGWLVQYWYQYFNVCSMYKRVFQLHKLCFLSPVTYVEWNKCWKICVRNVHLVLDSKYRIINIYVYICVYYLRCVCRTNVHTFNLFTVVLHKIIWFYFTHVILNIDFFCVNWHIIFFFFYFHSWKFMYYINCKFLINI